MKKIYRYKLTDQNMRTYRGCQWEIGKWKKTDGSGVLCGLGWLHCYDHPFLAILHNPIHADIFNPILWRVEVKGIENRNGQIKCGWTEMRLVNKAKIPVISTNQRVAYGIRCAMLVYKDKNFILWAKNWLSNNACSSGKAARVEVAQAAAAWAAQAAAVWAARAEARAGEQIDLIRIAKKAVKS
jgi:hypothetical protein